MPDSADRRFRRHPDTVVCDAQGVSLLSAVSPSASTLVLGADDLSGDGTSHRDAATATGKDVCFIRDEAAADTLRQVLQAACRGRVFCVIPKRIEPEKFVGAGKAGRLPYENGHEQSDTSRRLVEVTDLPQFQCLSSGTSGEARRIQRSHQSWIRSFSMNASLMDIGVEDSYAIVGSFSHSLPLYAVLEACHLGANVHLLSDVRPDRQLAAIGRLGSTVLYLTPTQARQLCRAQAVGSLAASRVRLVLCGGGKLDDKTRTALQVVFTGAVVIEFYGASETSFITMSGEQTPPGSVGQAYPGVSLKVLDARDEASTGVGEIWVSSDYLFSGYSHGDWRDTRQRDGYVSLGEMGQLDADGNLFLSGRKSHQANVADTTVFLEEIEAVMLQHAGVQQCVVVTRQDSLRGEILVAVVEGRHDDSLRGELLRYARLQLGPILAPRDILFLQTLPCLDAGKPDLRRIHKLAESL